MLNEKQDDFLYTALAYLVMALVGTSVAMIWLAVLLLVIPEVFINFPYMLRNLQFPHN
jgi:hypothetical protein